MRHNTIVHSGKLWRLLIDMRQTVFDWTSNWLRWQRSVRRASTSTTAAHKAIKCHKLILAIFRGGILIELFRIFGEFVTAAWAWTRICPHPGRLTSPVKAAPQLTAICESDADCDVPLDVNGLRGASSISIFTLISIFGSWLEVPPLIYWNVTELSTNTNIPTYIDIQYIHIYRYLNFVLFLADGKVHTGRTQRTFYAPLKSEYNKHSYSHIFILTHIHTLTHT